MKSGLHLFPTIVLFFILITGSCFSQDIYFCEDVDDDGYPVNESSSFTIPDEGGYLYVLVRLPYSVDCSSVSFEVYRNGDYDNTIALDTDADWTWFWKKITFYKSGNFNIKVYDDCYDDLLVNGRVSIDYQ